MVSCIPVRPWHPFLDTTVTARRAVPAAVTPLIGRAAELDQLDRLLEDERVVTLTGSGGCGKTRLAAEIATRVADRFPGGVAWVELAACTGADDVVAAVGAALGLLESPGERALPEVVNRLASAERSLVVLDNAEHVVVAVATVTASVTTGTASASVLATSREPIGVPGEVVWRVPSLAAPPRDQPERCTVEDIATFDAVLLFADRARRARRGFALTDANAAAVAQICTRLDGVPLAIELAAARVRTMPPERIAALLDDRFRLLSGGSRTALARQQTLQASVAWSEALLDDTERAVFRRLGVFAGGFTLAAAEAVGGAFGDVDGYDVAEIVARLVDKSLVQYDADRDRYGLLDTIQSYAAQRLVDTGEIVVARDAHASWCASWLASVVDDATIDDVNHWWTSRLAIIGLIAPEWPNCAAALDWVPTGGALSLELVTGLGDYWALRQRGSDSARYGMPALLAGHRDDPAWMRAVVSLQTVRTNAADAEFALLREEAIELARAMEHRRALIRLTLAHHIAAVMLFGPRAETLTALDEIRAEAEGLGEWYTVWNATQSPAVILAAAGRLTEAEDRVRALTSARALLIRSVVAGLGGDLAASDALAAEAQTLLDGRLGAVMDRVLVAFRAATVALLRDDVTALDTLGLDGVGTASLPGPLASAYGLARGVDEALRGRTADARATAAASPSGLFTSWSGTSLQVQVELAAGEIAAARDTCERLRSAVAEVSAPLYEAVAELGMAECAWVDDPAAALDHAHRALASAAAAGLRPAVVDALEAIGSLLVSNGRDREGGRLLAAADAARREMGYRHRFAHRATYVASASAPVQGSDGWSDGLALPLADAVDLAQRMRGERLRPLVGWDSLTPTERRVVEQVAMGLTNPQIADALLMSRATVKTHLVHVYAKLGLANRAELAAAVARREAS